MTGSQFHKTSRATSGSHSPRLKSTMPNKMSRPTNKDNDSQGPGQEKPNSELPKLEKMPNKGAVSTPVRPGKRRHQAIVSPITTRTESLSPQAKLRTLSSPVASQMASRAAPSSSSVSSLYPRLIEELLLPLDNVGNSVGNPLAVPKVSAEPPSPALLPSPPRHWIGKMNALGTAQKQQCRAITECLVSHLTSSGILVLAQ